MHKNQETLEFEFEFESGSKMNDENDFLYND